MQDFRKRIVFFKSLLGNLTVVYFKHDMKIIRNLFTKINIWKTLYTRYWQNVTYVNNEINAESREVANVK